MILTLMRHPAADFTGERCIGQTDVDLSPQGRRTLDALVDAALRLRPDRILCSDLKRCQILAEAIAGGVGRCVEPDLIWREVNFGTWENRTWNEIQSSEPGVLEEWMADFDRIAPPCGESFEQLQRRVLAGIAMLDAQERVLTIPSVEEAKSRYLVVTHAGVIRALLCAFSGLPLRRAFELEVPYGGQSSFYWDGNHWNVVGMAAGRRTFSWEGKR